MIQKTEAVILKTINHGDTSKIATLYSREYGRLKIIAKGVRNLKSRYVGLLAPVQYVRIEFYEKPTSELQLFKSGEIVQSYYTLFKDFDRLAFAQVAMEFIERTAEKSEPHPELFDLVVWVLNALNDEKSSPVKSYWYFHLRSLSELGFRPNVFQCQRCKTSLEGTGAVYHKPDGVLYCGNCSPTPDERFIIKLSPTVMNLLQAVDEERWPGARNSDTSLVDRRAIWAFIWHYAKIHLEPLRKMKSLHVLEQIYHSN